MSDIVEVQGLWKRFGNFNALAGLDLSIPEGSLFAVVGANGAGKTTLFSVLGGFLHATAGSWRMLGLDAPRGLALRARLGMLPQDAAFLSGVPVLDQLVFFARLQGLGPRAAHRECMRALDAVGLAAVAESNPRALSHGMLKRVALAQAFIGDPELVFLDEPTAGLDPETARRVRDLVRSMKGSRTVVISSHNLLELQELCTHVAVIHQGRTVSAGSMAEIASRGVSFRVLLEDDPSEALLELLRGLPEIARVEVRSAELHLGARAGTSRRAVATAVLEALLKAGVPPRRFQEGTTLEEHFLKSIGGRSDGLGGS
jgi:ABC-type multidrug transport system ATPase subunit